MKPIQTEKDLLTAIIAIYNNGNYQPWYYSFISPSFNIRSVEDLKSKIDKPFIADNGSDGKPRTLKREGMKDFTILECLGSNLVTDAMDPDDTNPYEWKDMPQVGLIEAIDKYVHK